MSHSNGFTALKENILDARSRQSEYVSLKTQSKGPEVSLNKSLLKHLRDEGFGKKLSIRVASGSKETTK